MGGFLMCVGAVVSTAAFGPQWGLGQFVVGRVVSGLGNGANTATIPVWQSEASQAKNRGLLVCLEGAVIAVGTFIAYWLDFGFSYINSSVQWRFPVSVAPHGSLSATTSCCLPEPRNSFSTGV